MNPTSFKAICRFDPALDAEAMKAKGTLQAFTETGDISKAILLDGDEATVFHCRRLKVSEMQSAKSHSTEADVFVSCFAHGVMKVEAMREVDDKGTVSRRTWVRPDADRRITAREIDETFDAGEVFEIGALIYGRSILGKGRPAAWPQPDTSRVAIAALAFHLRHAERMNKPDASSPQSKPAAEGQPPATENG